LVQGAARNDTFTDAIDQFGSAVLSRARDVQENAEKNTRRWKHLSFGLYPLGLLIGLVGKLSGGDEVEVEEIEEG
jgi:hypothetical protein